MRAPGTAGTGGQAAVRRLGLSSRLALPGLTPVSLGGYLRVRPTGIVPTVGRGALSSDG